MAEHITRCPKCHTSFRITDAHLSSAKGSVRCGSCLTIFNALDHLAIASTPPTDEKPTPTQEKEHEEELISDDMGLSGDDEHYSEEFTENVLRSGAENKSEMNLFERDSVSESEQDEDSTTDESWALDLLNSHEEEAEPPPPPPTEEDEHPEEEAEAGVDYESFYRTDKFQLIEEEEDLDEDEPPSQSGLHNTLDNMHYDEEEEHHDNIDYSDLHSPVPTPKITQGLSAQFLDSIEPEPVEFTWKTSSSWWNSNILWGTLSIIFAALLVGQFAWIKFDTLSRQKAYRPYYEQACEILGCKLPALRDPSQILTRNLMVRTNPKQRNSLIVEFILQNSAFFEQEFPSLELVFTDHKNEPVAARCFTSKEYLGGEMAGKKYMPTKQPIHIAIEISDPGNSASGYKIGICR